MIKDLEAYDLIPDGSQKSFYGKARVYYLDGCEYLQSYKTIVAKMDSFGDIHRYWNDWSVTTGEHLRAWKNINKAQWDKMQVEKEERSEFMSEFKIAMLFR